MHTNVIVCLSMVHIIFINNRNEDTLATIHCTEYASSVFMFNPRIHLETINVNIVDKTFHENAKLEGYLL